MSMVLEIAMTGGSGIVATAGGVAVMMSRGKRKTLQDLNDRLASIENEKRERQTLRPPLVPIDDTFWEDVVGIPIEAWTLAGVCHGPGGYSFPAGALAKLIERRESGEFEAERKYRDAVKAKKERPLILPAPMEIGTVEWATPSVRADYNILTDEARTRLERNLGKRESRHWSQQEWPQKHAVHEVTWRRQQENKNDGRHDYLTGNCEDCGEIWRYDYVTDEVKIIARIRHCELCGNQIQARGSHFYLMVDDRVMLCDGCAQWQISGTDFVLYGDNQTHMPKSILSPPPPPNPGLKHLR